MKKITVTFFLWQSLEYFWVPLWCPEGSFGVPVPPVVVLLWQNVLVQLSWSQWPLALQPQHRLMGCQCSGVWAHRVPAALKAKLRSWPPLGHVDLHTLLKERFFNGLAQTGVNFKNQIKHLHSRPWDPNCPVTAQLLHRHLQLHPLLLHHSTFQYSLPSQGTLSVSPTGKNCLMQSRGSVCAWQVVWYLENKMFVVKEHCPWYNHLKGIILGCLWSGPKLWLLSMN